MLTEHGTVVSAMGSSQVRRTLADAGSQPTDTPAILQRRLRSAIRRLRLVDGRTQKQVADALDWSESKVSRMESGTTPVTYTALRALLELYRVEPADAAELTALARQSRKRSWRDAHRQDIDPQFFLFLGYEESASRIRLCQSVIVPTPLQNDDYARAVAETLYGDDSAKVDRILRLGADRRQSWWQALRRRRVDILLDESVLHRNIGGTRTMREQLATIRAVASNENVTIRVVPLDAEGYLGMPASFHILDFADPDDDPVVFIEDPVSDAVTDIALRDDPDVDAYVSRFEEAGKYALSARRTLSRLDELVEKLDQ